MRQNVAFIESLRGVLHHMVFEKTQRSTLYDIVAIAVWRGPEAIATARDAVVSAIGPTGLGQTTSARAATQNRSLPRALTDERG